MKKFLLITISLFFISTSLFSQKIGLSAGLNIPNVKATYGNTVEKYVPMYTYRGGLSLEYEISRFFNIHTGIYGINSGAADFMSPDYIYSTHSVQVPVDFNLVYPFSGYWFLFGGAGGYGGYAYYGKLSGPGIDALDEILTFGKTAEKADFNGLDYGILINAGIGYEFFHISYCYGMGLADFSLNENIILQNRSHSINLTFYFSE